MLSTVKGIFSSNLMDVLQKGSAKIFDYVFLCCFRLLQEVQPQERYGERLLYFFRLVLTFAIHPVFRVRIYFLLGLDKISVLKWVLSELSQS